MKNIHEDYEAKIKSLKDKMAQLDKKQHATRERVDGGITHPEVAKVYIEIEKTFQEMQKLHIAELTKELADAKKKKLSRGTIMKIEGSIEFHKKELKSSIESEKEHQEDAKKPAKKSEAFVVHKDADTDKKIEALRYKRDILIAKEEALGKQSKDEFHKNGHTKKFYTLKIKQYETKLELTKLAQEIYKLRGNGDENNSLKEQIKGYSEEIKDYKKKMSEVGSKSESLKPAKVLKRVVESLDAIGELPTEEVDEPIKVEMGEEQETETEDLTDDDSVGVSVEDGEQFEVDVDESEEEMEIEDDGELVIESEEDEEELEEDEEEVELTEEEMDAEIEKEISEMSDEEIDSEELEEDEDEDALDEAKTLFPKDKQIKSMRRYLMKKGKPKLDAKKEEIVKVMKERRRAGISQKRKIMLTKKRKKLEAEYEKLEKIQRRAYEQLKKLEAERKEFNKKRRAEKKKAPKATA